MNHFWPIVTGVTLFDVWTLVHLAFWIVVGSVFWSLSNYGSRVFSFYGCLVVAISWELFERIAEKSWPSLWLDPESFLNSWIGDTSTCIVGVWGIWWLLDHRKRRAE